ncbi:MAG TPA: HEAT repeat domain-containing protein [Bryobacteraceae bacterium]|nr:HEAT repeat domain-containing protein [Bryobacteraceae bacterium]
MKAPGAPGENGGLRLYKRLLILTLTVGVASVVANLLSSALDARFHLSGPKELAALGGVLFLILCVTALFEHGVKIPGYFLYHRYCYLTDVKRAEVLRRWISHFAALQLGRGPRYIAAAEIWDRGERRDLVEVLLGALTKPDLRRRRILILGEPGSGKSTALERLTYDLAAYAARHFGMRGPIPILVRAGGPRSDDTLPALIADAVSSWSHGKTRQVLSEPECIRRLLEDRRIVLLVDALDELTGSRRDSMLAALSSVTTSGALEHISVVVTCRTRQDPQHALSDYENYSVLELSDDSIAAFIEIYGKDVRDAPRDIELRLQESGFLDPAGLGRNPFWLKQLISIGTEERTRSGILRVTVQESLRRELSKPHGALREWTRPANCSNEQIVDGCVAALGRLARDMDLRRTASRREMQQTLKLWLADPSTASSDIGLSAEQLIGLTRDAGLLERTPDPLAFAHRLLQEYLTAFDLHAASEEPSWLPRFVSDATRWQTLSLYGGLLSSVERDRFVGMLLSGAPEPRRLACAIAVYVGDNRFPEGSLSIRMLDQIKANLVRGEAADREVIASLQEFLVMGHDLAAVFLGCLLADSNSILRRRVCALLALSSSRKAIGLLARVGLADSDETVASQASGALALLGEIGLWEAIGQLSSDRSTTRIWAAKTLAAIADPSALNFLLRLDERPDVSPLPATSPAGDSYAREDAAITEAIRACSRANVGRLFTVLASGSAVQRVRVIGALNNVSDPRAFPALERCLRDPLLSIRDAALGSLKSLARMSEPKVDFSALAAALDKAVASGDDETSLWAAQELARLEGASGLTLLVEHAIVSKHAVQALIADDRPETVRFLIGALATHTGRIREELINVLSRSSCPQTDGMLLEAIPGGSAEFRSAAIRCLAESRRRAKSDSSPRGIINFNTGVLAPAPVNLLENTPYPIPGEASRQENVSESRKTIAAPQVQPIVAAAAEPGLVRSPFKSDAPVQLDTRPEAAIQALLLDALEREPDSATRISAIRALSSSNGDQVIAVLRRATWDEPEIKIEALRSLAYWPGDEAQRAIAACLSDANPKVRVEALLAAQRHTQGDFSGQILSLLHDPIEIIRHEALECALQSPKQEVRLAGWEAFGRSSLSVQTRVLTHKISFFDPAALPILHRVALGDDAEAAQVSIEAIASLSDPALESLLIKALNHKAAKVREAAVEALASYGDKTAIRALIAAWSQEKTVDVQDAILWRLADHEDKEADIVLLNALRHSELKVSITALHLLTKRPGPEISSALLDSLPDYCKTLTESTWSESKIEHFVREWPGTSEVYYPSNDPAERRAWFLTAALARREASEVVPGLIRALSHPAPAVQCAALLSLVGHESQEVIGALIKKLQSHAPVVQRCAIASLVSFRSADMDRVLGDLVGEGLPGVEDFVRKEAVTALRSRPLDRIAALLDDIYRRSGPAGRRRVVEVVAESDEPQARRLIFRAAADTDDDVREAALYGLAVFDDPDCLAALRAALDDRSQKVSGTAAWVLTRETNAAAKQLICDWVHETVLAARDGLTSSQIDALEVASSGLGQEFPDALQVAALALKSIRDPMRTADVLKLLNHLPVACTAAAFPVFVEGGSGSPLRERLDPPAGRSPEVETLLIEVAVQKLDTDRTADPARVWRDQFGELDETDLSAGFIQLLQARGRGILPRLGELLARRDTPEPVKCGLCMALGTVCAQVYASQFVAFLESPSEPLRKAAMRALMDLGDFASPQLIIAIAAGSPHAKIVATYIQTLLEGKELPDVPDLIDRSFLEMDTSVAQSKEKEERDMLRMSLEDHYRELFQRLAVVFLLTATGGLAAATVASMFGPKLVSLMYGVTTASAAALWPDRGLLSEWFGVLAAAWLGVPLALYQGWRFAAAGLFAAERRLAKRPIFILSAVIAAAPLGLFAASRVLLELMGSHLRNPMRLMQVSDRAALALAIAACSLVGFRRIWRWLALRMQASYITGVLSQPGRTQTSRRFNLRIMFVLQALSAVLLALALPIYITACLFLGALAWALLVSGVLWRVSSIRNRHPVSTFWAFSLTPIGPNLWLLATCPLVLLIVNVFPDALRHSLEFSHLTRMASLVPRPGLSPALSFRNLLLLTGWLSVTLSFVCAIVLTVVQTIANGISGVLPVFCARFAILLLGLLPGLLSAWVRNERLVALLTAAAVLLFFATLSLPPRPPWASFAALTMAVLAVSQLPTPILSGVYLWIVPAVVFPVPAAIQLLVTQRWKGWELLKQLSQDLTHGFDVQLSET